MGTVFLATLGHGPVVALKVLRPELAGDEAFLARFRHEIAAARRVAGWCTARVLAAGVEGTMPFLVTEYIDGPPLDRVMARSGPLPSPALEGFATGVAAALTAIHAAGIVHRDLKPANVLLASSGPRVIDFGIAQALDHSVRLTETGVVLGTPGWMAPEQLTGRPLGTPLDVFLWGGLVLYAGTGRKPFGDGPLDIVSARILHAEPDRGGLPRALAGLVGRALAKDPAARPAAAELLEELLGHPAETGQALTRTLQRTWVLPAIEADHSHGAPRPSGVRDMLAARAGWLALLVVTALALGLAGFRVRDPGREQPTAPVATAPTPPSPTGAAPAPDPPPAADPPMVESDEPEGSSDSGALESDNPKGSVTVDNAMGTAVRDGPIEFVVSDVRCGLDKFLAWRGLHRRTTRGQYCLIDVAATNIDDEPHDLSGITQFVYDPAGEAYRMDGGSHPISAAGGLFEKLESGARVTGTLAFDLPEEQQAVTLELHGTTSGNGVRVRLADESAGGPGPSAPPPVAGS